MGTLTNDIAIPLDGVSTFTIGQDTYTWGDGSILSYIGVSSDTTAYREAFSLSGANWFVENFAAEGKAALTIEDSATGSGRSFGAIHLWNEGGNVLKFANTFVGTIYGSDGADDITTGAAGAGQIHLAAGNDIITTGTGYVDQIELGSGNNVANIRAGENGVGIVRGGFDTDTVNISDGAFVDYVATGRGNDVVRVSGDVTFVDLGRGDDKLVIDGYIQSAKMGRDADTVIVKSVTGVTFVDGAEGVSTPGVNEDSDTLDFSAVASGLDIDLSPKAYVVDMAGGALVISHFENVIGGAGSDVIVGSAEANILNGGKGNDFITGGLGADDMTGGSGKDTFVFTSVKDSTVTANGRDTIFDFSGSAGDRIDLSEIDANTKMAGNQSFSFIGAAAFSHKAGELRYEKAASDTYVYGDVNGDGKSDFAIHLDDALAMTKGYFIL